MTNDTAMTKQESEVMIEQLKKVFEVVRLLDVDTLEMGNLKGVEDVDGFPCKCYDFWKKGTRCKNCTSREALQKKEKVLKLEYLNSNIYQVISKYIEIDGKPYVIELINAMKSDAIMDDDGRTELIKQLSGYNRELYTDALTGIYNRRYYEERIKNSDMTAGIAMIDLDDFKLYNDIYGHDMGDRVLKTVADAINHCIRKTDKLVRYGGDEFLLILPNMVRGTLRGKLLQIQEAIQNAKIPECSRLRLTASIGGVLSENETIDEAIARADHLMYKAKDYKAIVVTECDKKMPDDEETKNKPRIMIVDDSEFNREILSEILQEDYEIVEAESGREALHKLGEYGLGISLVLLDIIMPEMDGFEVLKHMTEEDWISNVPVIMISSEDSENYIRRAYEMGVTDYINRPFDANIVYQRVSNTVKLYAKQRRLMALVT